MDRVETRFYHNRDQGVKSSRFHPIGGEMTLNSNSTEFPSTDRTSCLTLPIDKLSSSVLVMGGKLLIGTTKSLFLRREPLIAHLTKPTSASPLKLWEEAMMAHQFVTSNNPAAAASCASNLLVETPLKANPRQDTSSTSCVKSDTADQAYMVTAKR
jgi:hypothetical protein